MQKPQKLIKNSSASLNKLLIVRWAQYPLDFDKKNYKELILRGTRMIRIFTFVKTIVLLRGAKRRSNLFKGLSAFIKYLLCLISARSRRSPAEIRRGGEGLRSPAKKFSLAKTPNAKVLKLLSGQAASEVAIFGAVLIFILGMIIRYALANNYNQNQQLAAMRWALTQSYTAALTHYDSAKASRNVASVMYIEDRKDVEGSGIKEHLSVSRTPYIMSGSGAFTNKLMMGMEYGDSQDLPVMDMWVNGRHFSFTTAGWGTVPGVGFFNAVYQGTTRRLDTQQNCFYGGTNYGNQMWPCNILYTRIDSSDPKFCALDSCGAGLRFDLDRNPATSCSDTNPQCPPRCTTGCPEAPYGVDIPSTMWESYAWQWYPVHVSTDQINFSGDNSFQSMDIDGDLKEESVLKIRDNRNRWFTPFTRIPEDDGSKDPVKDPAHIYDLNYIDYQSGDFDFSYDSWDAYGKPTIKEPNRITAPPRAGLRMESAIYTIVNGAYMLNEAGKLYNDSNNTNTKQYVRDTTRHDSVDMVERSVQFSNDTGRFCTTDGHVALEGWPCYCPNPFSAPCPPNPLTCPPQIQPELEACGDCFSLTNKTKNCYDRFTKILWIRSRIEDKRGRKWITDVSADKNPIKGPLDN